MTTTKTAGLTATECVGVTETQQLKIDAYTPYKIVYSDGKEQIKTRWDIALLSARFPNDFTEDIGGVIKYNGKTFSFIAFPLLGELK